MLHLHGGDSLVLRRRIVLSRLLKSQALRLPTKRFWACTHFGGMYGLKTFQQCFVQSPCIVSPTTSCKGHWLQVTTCDNDLISLLSPQKTATWSGRVSCIGCYSGIFTRRLYVCYCIFFIISLYLLSMLISHCTVCMLLWFVFVKSY